jgi:hypothetical protein
VFLPEHGKGRYPIYVKQGGAAWQAITVAKEALLLGIGNYSSKASRLEAICDHYLDLGRGLREASGRQVIWPCPGCGQGTFVVSSDEGVVGCAEEGCEVPASMGLLELVAYLDEDLEVGDEQGASEKISEILETTVRRKQERDANRQEQRRRARDERYWQKGLRRARQREQGCSEERLF